MDASYLFTAALQLLSPWKVGSVDFRDAGDGWLRNEESLTELQVETKRGLTRQRLKTARACRMREVLQDIYMDGRTPADAWVGLYRLCSWMMHSRLEPHEEARPSGPPPLRRDRRLFRAPVRQRRARGRRQRHPERQTTGTRLPQHGLFATMIYLTCGKLDLKTITTT